jgi:hypothetical protein
MAMLGENGLINGTKVSDIAAGHIYKMSKDNSSVIYMHASYVHRREADCKEEEISR